MNRDELLLANVLRGMQAGDEMSEALSRCAPMMALEIPLVTFGHSAQNYGLPRVVVVRLVSHFLGSALRGHVAFLEALLEKSGSPIESLFLMALVGEAALLRQDKQLVVNIEAQVPIAQYRVDVLLTVGNRRVVVECDGHEFHEKTKSQASRDKRRDRKLVRDGYQVLRFTGSDVWNDPLGCAREAMAVACGDVGGEATSS